MKAKRSYIQQNISMKEAEQAELAKLMENGWQAVNILRLGILQAKKEPEPRKIDIFEVGKDEK